MSKKILSLIMVFALLAGILLVPGVVPEAKAASTTVYYENSGSPLWSNSSGTGVQFWNYDKASDMVGKSFTIDMKVAVSGSGQLVLRVFNFDRTSSYYPATISSTNSGVPAATRQKLAQGDSVRVSLSFNASTNKYSVWYDGVRAVEAGLWETGFKFGYLKFEFTDNVSISSLKVYDSIRPESDPAEAKMVYMNTDFENGNGGAALIGDSGTDTYEVQTDSLTGNKYVMLDNKGGSGNARIYASIGTYAVSNYVKFSFDIATTDIDTTFVKVNGASATKSIATISNTGVITYLGSGNQSKISENGTFVNVKILLDTDSSKYSLWFNNVKVVENATAETGRVNYLQIEQTGTAGHIMVDNLLISGYLPEEEIPEVTEEPINWPVVIDQNYLSWNFEDGTAGFVNTGGGAATNTLEIRNSNGNQYVYLARGANGQAQAYKSASGLTNSDYLLISFDLATTSLKNSVLFKLAPTISGGTVPAFYAFSFGETGMVVSNNDDTSVTMTADGQFKKFIILMDFSAHTYSIYIDGQLEISEHSFAGDALGSLQFEQSGVDGNLMIDNFYISSYKPVKFSAAAPVLENNLAINFKADATLFAEDCYSDPYATFTFKDETVTVTDYEVVDGKYVFKFNNIAPHQMGDKVTYTISATYNGATVTSPAKEYSILDYCTWVFENSSDAKLKTLATDLLNYGAAAQTYKDYNTEALVNDGIDQSVATADRTLVPVTLKGTEITDPAVNWTGATLVLENAITVRLKFTAASVEGLTVKINGEPVEPVSAGAGVWYVYYNGLNAAQLSQEIVAQVFNGDTAVSNTLTYSVESYADYQVKNSSDANLIALVKAMMKYGDSADNYS